ncbi:MAG: glycerophosphodiester phosphodiesterase [Thermoplasmata archaeon]|nr:glycerophosphodiester phosphodiesterase [Candidatus Sysuiplasma acidicola]MBX8645880.1 glycerophosphodiester phosphodiesterase [Candidatus Sysuiplasma acidicola]MDH2904743.1 glycerophosphodiester phosphodiesterase family protein [Methanomassiliicoccales archaeon]
MSEVSSFVSYSGNRTSPFVIGHRGAAGHAPENTLSSFSLAIEMGADAVEFDIHQTADNRIVVIHDEALDRTTDGEGMVMSTTLGDIKKLDAGSWFGEKFSGERIPTLEETLTHICGGAIALVEVKHGTDFYPHIEENIIKTVSGKKEWLRKAIFISFDPSVIAKLKELNREITVGLLTLDPPEEYLEIAKEFGASALFPRWEKMKPDSVKLVHEEGCTVHPWVMDKEEDINRVLEMRPDSLSSNFPDRLLTAVRSR